MKTTGIYSTVFHYIFMFFGIMMVITAVFGLYGQTIMVIASILAILLWGTYVCLTAYALKQSISVIKGDSSKLNNCLTWSSKLFFTYTMLCIGSSWVIGFGYFAACGPAWLAPLCHWGGLAGSFVGFCAWYIYRYVVRASLGSSGGRYAEPMAWWSPVVSGLVTYGVWGILWLIFYLILSGPIKTSDYPDRASTPHMLPYPAGTSSWVVQSNNTNVSHDDGSYAYDFRLSCGTPVVASHAGKVKKVVQNHDKGYDKGPNNYIKIEHTDGGVTTYSLYAHIEKNSAVVEEDNDVKQGQTIASVGNVGKSMTGHIHYELQDSSGKEIPVSFKDSDVKDDKGIPRTFKRYKSSNKEQ